MSNPFDQSPWPIRLEWGRVGALAVPADVAVVVDVLSFTTSVTVACARGARVWPCPWHDPRAETLATSVDAVLAVGRSSAGPDDVSLSPAAVLRSRAPRIVLPSPNGSTIAAALSDIGSTVLAGSLRNRGAVGAWVRAQLAARADAAVVVVAAGERWPDGSLRPAVEDLLGAGAVLDAIGLEGARSPEAQAAVAAFRAARFPWDLRDCASGRELVASGHPDDVEAAGALDADDVVPVLVDGAFEAAAS